jgi:hypothetical protein
VWSLFSTDIISGDHTLLTSVKKLQGIRPTLKESHDAIFSLLRSLALGLRVERTPVTRIAYRVRQSAYTGRETVRNILKSEIREESLEMTRNMHLASAAHRLQVANR